MRKKTLQTFKRYCGLSASLHENERIDNMSEDATNQSNCSSDGKSIESNVDEDVSTKVNVSVPCPSGCACMCKGCADLSISHHLIAQGVRICQQEKN